MSWQIDKRIDFCYGHRVWSQQLEKDFCAGGDTAMKCRHLHGHEGSIHVFLESDQLDRGFVTDFKHLGWLQDFIDDYIDHKFIVDINDPAWVSIVDGWNFGTTNAVKTTGDWNERVEVPALTKFTDVVLLSELDNQSGWCVPEGAQDETEQTHWQRELLEGFLFVDFVPTSENLAKWIYDIVDRKMKALGAKTARIEWFETPKSRSTYIGDK